MLLIIDNYDSFTYNLVQYFQRLGQEVLVYTHDNIDLQIIQQLAPEHLVISPGPKGPEETGIALAAIKHFYRNIPMLGICLGHQCLAYAFDAQIIQAPDIIHGKKSSIIHNKQGLFRGLPSPFLAARLGIQTFFNLLRLLINPASVKKQNDIGKQLKQSI